MSLFKKAERKQSKLRLGLNGPSGSGKTYSALLIAKGLGSKIAVADTEKGSASLYSDLFHFDTIELSPPFTPDKYIQAIEAAEKEKYDVLIIDSFSHAWMGEGGVLEQKALLDQNPKSNQFANWKKPKEGFTRLKNAIIFSDIHIICTFRSKQAYEQVVDEHGRKKVDKLGLEPMTEPGAEYEFTTVLDIGMNHFATTSKDRSGLFDGATFRPGEETGKILLEWLNSGRSVWKFDEDKKAELRAMIKLGPEYDAAFRQWEKEHGPISGIDEEYYKSLKLALFCVKPSQPISVSPEFDKAYLDTFPQVQGKDMRHVK